MDTKKTKYLIYIPLLLLLFIATNISREELRVGRETLSIRDTPPIYLPSAEYVKLVTLGFDNAVSDVLWFNTLNYVGKEFKSGKDYKWLYSMCNLVTKLNPKNKHPYEFCATLISWLAKKPRQSNQILTRAIETYPNNWRFYYLRGFNWWYFIENQEKAQRDFLTASKIKDAPVFLSSLSSRLISKNKSPEDAVKFLQSMIENSSDPIAVEALTDKFKQSIRQ